MNNKKSDDDSFCVLFAGRKKQRAAKEKAGLAKVSIASSAAEVGDLLCFIKQEVMLCCYVMSDSRYQCLLIIVPSNEKSPSFTFVCVKVCARTHSPGNRPFVM